MEPISPSVIQQIPPARSHEDATIMQQIVDAALATRHPEVTSLFCYQINHRQIDVWTTSKLAAILLQARILDEDIVSKIVLYQALRTGAVAEAKEMLSLFETNESKQGFILFVLKQAVEFGLDYDVLLNLGKVSFFSRFAPPKAFLECALDLALRKKNFGLINDLIVIPRHPPENVALIQTFLKLYSTRHESFSVLFRLLAPLETFSFEPPSIPEDSHQPIVLDDLSSDLPEQPLFPTVEKSSKDRLIEAFEERDYLQLRDCLTDDMTHVDVKDVEGMTLVHWAMKECHIELALKLIRMGASISHLIIPSYHEDFIRFVKALTTLPNVQKDLPYLLVEHSRVQCVAFFSQLGLKNRPSDPKIDTLLNQAIKHGFISLARYLIETNALSNPSDGIIEPCEEILNLDLNDPQTLNVCRLLAHKCDFNNLRYKGKTLLHIAILRNKWEWIQLLANRQSVRIPDKWGRTPLELAKRVNLERVVDLVNSLTSD